MSGRQDTGARRTSDQPGTPGTTASAAATDAPVDASPATASPPGTTPLIPTQAGHAISAPVPVVPARITLVPTQPAAPTHSTALPVVPAPSRPADAPAADAPAVAAPSAPTTAPDALVAPGAPRAFVAPDTFVAPGALVAPDVLPAAQPVRRRGRQVVALLTAAAVLVAAGGVWAVQQERAERADAQRAAQARVDGVRLALAPELTAGRVDGLVAGAAVVAGMRDDAGAAGRAAVDHANATLAAAAQAGDGPRGALQDAIGGASGALDAPAVSLTTLRTTTAALAAPEQAVVDAQAAWQAAEDARIAAEAAARAAAAQAAQAARGKGTGTGTTARRSTGAGSTGTASGGSAGAPAAGAPAAAGLPTAGSEASSGDVGAALNAHRAANGLGGLSIVRSGARVEHAMQMAASNSIWHSGTRAGSPKARPEIVGRVSPGNATRMIAAYAASGSHNEQMLGGYSTAYIGAVSYDGWLYTSITFG